MALQSLVLPPSQHPPATTTPTGATIPTAPPPPQYPLKSTPPTGTAISIAPPPSQHTPAPTPPTGTATSIARPQYTPVLAPPSSPIGTATPVAPTVAPINFADAAHIYAISRNCVDLDIRKLELIDTLPFPAGIDDCDGVRQLISSARLVLADILAWCDDFASDTLDSPQVCRLLLWKDLITSMIVFRAVEHSGFVDEGGDRRACFTVVVFDGHHRLQSRTPVRLL